MKILALDSSGLVASVAISEEDRLLAEFTLNYKLTHSQTLLPMLDKIKEITELDLYTLDAIAVASGPGSFTGLRIGSATAKGLGLVLEIPIIGIPTIDGLAYNLYGSDNIVCPILDARRNQVYTGIYTFREEGENYCLETLWKQCAVSIDELLNMLTRIGRKVIFLGDGVPVFESRIREKLTVPFSFAPIHMNRQRAASLAALASVYYREGKMTSAAVHQPEYLRMAQAERERLEKQKC